MDIKIILAEAVKLGASDLHINVGMSPVIRKNTELIELNFPVISDENCPFL